MNPISRFARSVRKRVKPTERELAVKRWRKDDGDNQHRYNCLLDPGSIVFDMGGFEGSWAAEIFSRYACRVEIFEPAPTFAEKIKNRFAKNPYLRVHTCGLAARTRSEHLSLSSDASSVFIKPDGATVPIELVDAKEWFDRNPTPRVDFMKINIEGGEYELLERLIETGLISRVVQLHIQFHEIAVDSKARMEAIRGKLALTHDALFHYTFVWDGWRLKGA
jgi:FkbM family methyltransferase